jgi:hypothetical protein
MRLMWSFRIAMESQNSGTDQQELQTGADLVIDYSEQGSNQAEPTEPEPHTS